VDSIAVLDFGSQYSQLIARRVREARVYCELFPHDAPSDRVLGLHPKGFILSGGPASVYEPGAPQIPDYVLHSGLPILGICYGMQALTRALGGRVAASDRREYGPAEIQVLASNPLLPAGGQPVWMSHGDRIEAPPPGFTVLACSPNSPIAAMGNLASNYYGLQFHPEVRHTPGGVAILRAFVLEVCQARPEWTPESIVSTSLEQLRLQIGRERAIAGVSGGVDSAVAAALVHQAVGDQLTCIFINTGLLRLGEPESVVDAFDRRLGAKLETVEAEEEFLSALAGVGEPEEKRRIIGKKFIRLFEAEARRIGAVRFLVQGTIYPDVVESSGPDRRVAARIKTHHNVGGLPTDLALELVEPLRYLFKDEVRAVGLALGLPEQLVWRQPFPGPGLAVRCLGELNRERLARLRRADSILTEELHSAGLIPSGQRDETRDQSSQAFAVLLPVRSVGVMGDQRTYGETIAVRAVTTDDFMTADWTRLPHEVLAQISKRIVNEVPGITRVVYDVTSKPPATIEWE
jgi:GMP synthase (glutamine-hydrolysing)